MLEISGLKKKYGDFELNCSMRVEAGRITGLIGENGAGKSAAFKAVLGLISTDGGTIKIFGKDSRNLSITDRQKIGVVLADSGFSGYLTVNDIIPVLENLYERFERDFFLKQIRKFNLPEHKKIREFSTGMKAKLKLLVAAGSHPQLLILDEPTVGLDVIARDELLEMLREYMEQNEKNSILISSHISSDLETLCDDVYMIHEGRIVMHEDVDVLLSEYALLKVSDEQYAGLDKQYLLRMKKEPYGYSCLTDQKQYYMENYPAAVIEKGTIDSVMTMMIRGSEV
ncbi:MAG: ATP-binding cassette domain-containing protein [Ruminococcus sp.]|jgi:ABC-2 type transport system ATP-binding protein